MIWLVKVTTSHVQGNGDDNVIFTHVNIHSACRTCERALEEAETVRRTWKGDIVTQLEDVEVESILVRN